MGLLIDGVRIVTSLSTIPPSHMPNCKIREIGRVTRDLKVSLTIVRSLSVEGIFAVSWSPADVCRISWRTRGITKIFRKKGYVCRSIRFDFVNFYPSFFPLLVQICTSWEYRCVRSYQPSRVKITVKTFVRCSSRTQRSKMREIRNFWLTSGLCTPPEVGSREGRVYHTSLRSCLSRTLFLPSPFPKLRPGNDSAIFYQARSHNPEQINFGTKKSYLHGNWTRKGPLRDVRGGWCQEREKERICMHP